MPTRPSYLFPAALTAFFTFIFILEFWGIAPFLFDRVLIEGGEYWRIVSGNWVHNQLAHFLMNLAGLWLIWFLFDPRVSVLEWFLVSFVISIAVGIGVYFLNPEIRYYLGFSAVLKGLFIFGVMREMKVRRQVGLIFLLVFLTLMVLEWVNGGLPGSTQMLDGKPAILAHGVGAVSGLVLFLILAVFQKKSFT